MNMKLSNMSTYFDSLLSMFHKKDIALDAAHAFEELSQIVSPMYSLSPIPNFSGKVWEDTSYSFKKDIKAYKESPYKTIFNTIAMILNNQDEIEKIILKDFSDENYKNITDYYKLNLLKYIEGLTFFNDYTRMWISSAVCETTNLTLKQAGIHEEIKSPVFIRNAAFVTNHDNMAAFGVLVNMLSLPFKDFLNEIKNLKGHLYNESEWANTTTPSNRKLDPFGANFIPVSFNPIYHIGLAVNGWRVARHERNKEELAALQLMIMSLQQEQTETSDPNRSASLKRQIEYHLNRVNSLSAKIESMEEGD